MENIPPPSFNLSLKQEENATKSLPIHVIIEQTNAPPSFDAQECGNKSDVELDSYAILPCNTLFCDLVRSALVKLGYNSTQTVSAKGAIQIKNWQPLSFDVISNDKKATIEDILGELTQVATLRIRLCSNKKMSSTDEIKGKLLQLLLNHSHGLLLSSGCPIEKEQLSTITRDSSFADLPVELRRAFDIWYQSQVQKLQKMDEEGISSADESREKTTTANGLDLSDLHNGQSQNHGTSLSGLVKTRMRTSFDPEHEIPRLQKWFQDCQHPSREQMIRYLGELNSLDSRKGRRPLDLTNIIYWFKNARAAHRRASRNFDDNSFDDENVENMTELEKSMPYLPNKNAVYVVPYPYHGSYISNDSSHDREPCDLSHRKSTSSPDVKTENSDNDLKHLDADEENKIRRFEKMPERAKIIKSESDEEKAMDCSIHHLNGEQGELSRLCSQDRDSTRSNGTHPSENSSRNSDSEDAEDDDGMESDADSVSKDVGDSSHRRMLASLKHDYPEASEYISSHMTHLQSPTGRGLTQPLHIPHFPHPLAMHYFPMNTHYLPQHSPASRLHQHQHSPTQLSPHQKSSNNSSHRKRRTRVFIDPMTEIPKLEKWFMEDTHPSSYMIDKYCEELNHSEYRQKFPKLEAKNVQLWFKNHRAKVKRMRVSQVN